MLEHLSEQQALKKSRFLSNRLSSLAAKRFATPAAHQFLGLSLS